MLNSYKNYPPGLNRRLKYSHELQERQNIRPFTRNEILIDVLRSTIRPYIDFQGYFEREFQQGLVSENLLNNSNVGIFLTINKNDDICPICIDHFVLNSIYRKLICNHVFHIKCIDKWFINNNKCPLCRNSIN